MGTKRCRKCDQEKPLSEFSNHRTTKDRLDARCKDCVKMVKKNIKVAKEYPIRECDLNSSEWQVGKVAGTILKRTGPDRYEVRMARSESDKRLTSKSFSIFRYPNQEEAEKAALNYQHEQSDLRNLTRNKIRKIDENTIEVQLTKDRTMLTDVEFLDLCQKYSICVSRSDNEHAEYYAVMTIGNKIVQFHKKITGNSMTDHINRNTLDNRTCNLRSATYKLNNNNRNMIKDTKTTICPGVRFVSDRPEGSWEARIKQDGKEIGKRFSVKKFGNEGAKCMAVAFRKSLNEMYNCQNGEDPETGELLAKQDALIQSDKKSRERVRRTKISERMKEFNATPQGKKLKDLSHVKRSATMNTQRQEFRDGIENKTCTKCKIEKPVAKFSIKRDTKDGYQPYCRDCIAIAKRKSRQRKRET